MQHASINGTISKSLKYPVRSTVGYAMERLKYGKKGSSVIPHLGTLACTTLFSLSTYV